MLIVGVVNFVDQKQDEFIDATTAEQIDQALQQAWRAFHIYRTMPLKRRADFMRAVAGKSKPAVMS